MQDLCKVRLKPLENGNFALSAYNTLGCHIEKELVLSEIESCVLTQEFLDITLKGGKRYQIWLCDLDFSKPFVPLYVRGVAVGDSPLYVLYALAAEVSQYVFGFSKDVDRNYLRITKEFESFWKDHDMVKMLRILMRTAGANIPDEYSRDW